MRWQMLWLLLGVALVVSASEYEDEPVEQPEEDADEPGDGLPDREAAHERRERELEHEQPRCYSPMSRPRRSAAHQYEVHEVSDERAPASPPYEEMLAASADRHQRVAAAPAHAPRHDQDVSAAAPPIPHPGAQLDPSRDAPGPPEQVVTLHRYRRLQQPAPPPPPLPAAGQHGRSTLAQHHSDQGGKSSKGFKQDEYVEKGGRGHKSDELHKKEYAEALGNKHKQRDGAAHRAAHSERAHGLRAAHFAHKTGHKKGHKTKGYHNKYHKDEFHKEHKFYDDYHKSGEHHRFGKFNAKHASNESGNKKAHHVNAGHDFVERGKKGYSNKGHVDADHRGHAGQRGHEQQRQHQSSRGKQGAREAHHG